MVVPLVIIHFIFGCSIINQPAIGVPPFKDTPISTSTKPHEGFTLHLRHIAWSHLATTSWRGHCKESGMEPFRMSSPRGSKIPWRSLLPCSSLHQIEWRRSSLEASGQGCSAWTLHGDKKEWASGAKIHLVMVRIWVIIWRRKSETTFWRRFAMLRLSISSGGMAFSGVCPRPSELPSSPISLLNTWLAQKLEEIGGTKKNILDSLRLLLIFITI